MIGMYSKKVAEITIPAGVTLYRTLSDLDPNGDYYAKFEAPSDFSGTFTAQ